MADKEPNLRQRMAAAMADINRVAKDGRNEQQKYDYTKADDIITEVRKALIAHGIVFLSSEVDQQRLPDREARSGSAILGVVVKMQFTLMDTTSDEKLVAGHSGEGMDSGDKAVNKAKTAALKYFLQQTFLIPTGDDPEKDDHDVKTVTKDKKIMGETFKRQPIHQGSGGLLATSEQKQLLIDVVNKTGQGNWFAKRLRELNITFDTMLIQHYEMLSHEVAATGTPPTGEESQERVEADVNW